MSETKVCSACGEEKPLGDYHRHPNALHGRHPMCRPCKNAANRESSRRVTADPVRRAARSRAQRARRYGLSPEAVDLLASGACHVCGAVSDAPLHVDHCHDSGAIRGALCRECNTGLGKLGDSIPGLERAIAYLERAATFAAVDSVVLDAGHPHAA